MYKKFSQLSFVIGLFFSIVAIILFVTFLSDAAATNLTLYTSLVFFIFGVCMMLLRTKETGSHT